MEVIFAGLRHSGRWDLEAIEMRIRAAAHQMGAKVLQELLQAPESFERERPCGCGQKARFHQMRPRRLLTDVGVVRFERPYYLCPSCQQHLFIGSGVIEAGCKTIIGSRLKQSGSSGLCAVPMPSSPSAQTALAGGSNNTGRTVSGPHDLHNYVAYPAVGSGSSLTTPAASRVFSFDFFFLFAHPCVCARVHFGSTSST